MYSAFLWNSRGSRRPLFFVFFSPIAAKKHRKNETSGKSKSSPIEKKTTHAINVDGGKGTMGGGRTGLGTKPGPLAP